MTPLFQFTSNNQRIELATVMNIVSKDSETSISYATYLEKHPMKHTLVANGRIAVSF